MTHERHTCLTTAPKTGWGTKSGTTSTWALDEHEMTYQLDAATVDDGEGAVADQVLGRVLVDAHALHLDSTDYSQATS